MEYSSDVPVIGPTVNIYDINNYDKKTKEAIMEKDKSVQDRMARFKENYEKEGMRRSVEAILVVHQHKHPLILMLQIGGTYFKLYVMDPFDSFLVLVHIQVLGVTPGGKLKPGESEIQGLKRKLNSKLRRKGDEIDWQIGELVAQWWRPNYETLMYPYLPPHITQPKECKKIFLVHLPESCEISVPSNMELLAVPLIELYDNVKKYGSLISSIPHLLSKTNFVCL